MKSEMFRYKGTKQLVKIGDTVELSHRYATQFGYNGGVVVGLHGFPRPKIRPRCRQPIQ
jgi:hypothetical protein